MAAKSLSKEEKIEAVETAIFERFIETGEFAPIAEIAERLSWTVSRVRSVINDLNGVVSVDRSKATRSKDYGWHHGYVSVRCYAPSRDRLRAAVTDLRASLSLAVS